MGAALYGALGPVTAVASLNDRLQWLRDLGILTPAAAERWASCLKVRRKILMPDRNGRPAKREITAALAIMRALTTELEQIGQQR